MPMDADLWRRMQELFHEAADLPPEAQRAFVEEASQGNDTLRDDVLALLSHDARGASLLDRGLARAARDVMVADHEIGRASCRERV